MSITKDTIISELVAKDYRVASVFKQNKIDFCCNGNRSIDEACTLKNIDVATLIQQLENATTQQQNNNIDYNTFPLDLLADYIEKKHHRYVETKIQEILPFLEKIMKVHGDRHPELITVFDEFKESSGELTMHMKKEELILFPFIRKMVKATLDGTSVQAPFGTVQNPISMMMSEHVAEGERFQKIADLTNNYTPPADACNTYKVTFALLKEYEEDLHMHIHLENNILFPKAIALEQTFATV
ncbi:MAG TPA: iron-sulfur cluster repair di-iron protein [Chitinophagales bacterium]|jgi:regulator of cell morphogenesis and NO signaling|nr:iron-sulfur cluster repair di-iron protein [Chitinophagales bacterium]MBP6153272.1 iron-sulfur cluster repair di-iron protein [Chitinophagales bacterium]HQV78468.1 iron-sulfur cluster repair di-iron protein [Chitinophagales bacterium]HQW78846.1 iron-sulfur cluster repair di-iron protein [Chitinophagales bacterium]HRB18945.1 iron-sulfur cluster repair di-iron protein [Chitinophagales bacterium]